MTDTLKEYAEFTKTTAVYPQEHALTYLVLGLASEAGEVANKYKKIVRGDNISTDALIPELGDVVWYVVSLAQELGTSVEELMQQNMAKLSDRKARGVLQGEGDNR